jgi:hypothetical protein
MPISRNVERLFAEREASAQSRYAAAFPRDPLPRFYWQSDDMAGLDALLERAIEAGKPLTADDLLSRQGLDPTQPGEVV